MCSWLTEGVRRVAGTGPGYELAGTALAQRRVCDSIHQRCRYPFARAAGRVSGQRRRKMCVSGRPMRRRNVAGDGSRVARRERGSAFGAQTGQLVEDGKTQRSGTGCSRRLCLTAPGTHTGVDDCRVCRQTDVDGRGLNRRAGGNTDCEFALRCVGTVGSVGKVGKVGSGLEYQGPRILAAQRGGDAHCEDY
jgi:hypothetical protein